MDLQGSYTMSDPKITTRVTDYHKFETSGEITSSAQGEQKVYLIENLHLKDEFIDIAALLKKAKLTFDPSIYTVIYLANATKPLKEIRNSTDRTYIRIQGNCSLSAEIKGTNVYIIGDKQANIMVGSPVADKFLCGGGGDDDIRGGLGDDDLYGGDGNDKIDGNEDNDFLFGQDGNDLLLGNSGNDSLYGEQGSDKLTGGHGDDCLEGGAGDDWLCGDEGNDILNGGEGDDTYIFNGNWGSDTVLDTQGSLVFGDYAPENLAITADADDLVLSKIEQNIKSEVRILNFFTTNTQFSFYGPQKQKYNFKDQGGQVFNLESTIK